MKNVIRIFILFISVYIYSCGGGGGNQTQIDSNIETSDSERPVYKTSDGKEFKLLTEEEIKKDIEYNELISKFEEELSKKEGIFIAGELPEKVFLKDIQTIRVVGELA